MAVNTRTEGLPGWNRWKSRSPHERWIHEIKFDGYRVQLHIANESASVFNRNGIDWTWRFKKIAEDAFLINAGSAGPLLQMPDLFTDGFADVAAIAAGG